MKFEVGKFYAHSGGRHIAVLGVVETFKWGPSFVIEEADATGHGISIMEFSESKIVEVGTWVEIGREEWLGNFKNELCLHCDKCFEAGCKFVPTEDGPVHIECFSDYLKSTGRSSIITKDNPQNGK